MKMEMEMEMETEMETDMETEMETEINSGSITTSLVFSHASKVTILNFWQDRRTLSRNFLNVLFLGR